MPMPAKSRPAGPGEIHARVMRDLSKFWHQRWRVAVAARIPLRTKQIVLALDDNVSLAAVAHIEVGEAHRVLEGVAPVPIGLRVFAVALDLPLAVIHDVV